ncbi:MAG TPA: hypothetical protein VFW00_12455 [Rhodocyclaceae bacterium]|nr:hypothetical protein [Rhodocyclaceae bacterium]
MSAVWQELERVEMRALTALRCVDATTGAPINAVLQIQGDFATMLRNRSGLYVIRDWQPLAAHTIVFDAPPATPSIGSQPLTLTITDPAGNYLSRLVTISLPRDPDPAHADDAASLFNPIVVPMYPNGILPLGANWAPVRVSLTDTNSGDALGGALLLVTSNGTVLARGMTDWRGEALVPVAGIPVTTWSSDPHAVIVSQIDASLEVVFDPAAGTRTSAISVSAGTAPAVLPLVDPARIEAQRATLQQTSTAVQLAAGRPLHVSLNLALP